MSLRSRLRQIPLIAMSALILATLLAAGNGGGGNVMPANAKPHGYSLADMAEAVAYFTASFNDPANYPDTPFQILYVQDFNTGTGAFTVRPGTQLFVPLFGVSDSPPPVGDFPTSARGAANYLFGAGQLGIEELQLEVDGQITDIGPGYSAGPASTPGLADGGSHFIQLGAFLTPLNKGVHTIKIHFFADGAALEPFGGVFAFDDVYTVTVK